MSPPFQSEISMFRGVNAGLSPYQLSLICAGPVIEGVCLQRHQDNGGRNGGRTI